MKEIFGQTPDGKNVYLFTLKNANGMEMKITNFGGIVHSIIAPDKNGVFEDVLLGYKDFKGYLGKENPYFGCIVGRLGNRLANGKFSLDGVEYQVAKNDGKNHLHGGIKGFDKVLWDAKEFTNAEGSGVELSYLSPDGEEGYPGNLNVTVIYTLTNNNEFKIKYLASCDKATPVNLTHHAYFNLCGNGKRDVFDHQVKIDAGSITEINEELIPTGKIVAVEGTPFDFRQIKSIGKDFKNTKAGYDHNFVLDGSGLRKVAEVIEPQSKRMMEVYTTSVGMQFYSGNFLDGGIVGKKGEAYKKYEGFCFETQYFPDSPNQTAFPSCILQPGKKFEQETIYKFSISNK